LRELWEDMRRRDPHELRPVELAQVAGKGT